MSAFENLAPENQRRLEEAAAWWDRLQKEPAIELSADFLEWVADPVNSRALKAVESTMTALDDFGATPNILDMRRAALTRLRNAGTKRWFPRNWAYAAAAAVVLVLVGSGAVYYSQINRPLSYRTDVGERRVVALPDGSRISLDSNSLVDVRYSASARAIVLEKGRARFDVAHDTTRPFTVTAGNETVVAVGTSFDVERRGSAVFVTLIQGHVFIKHATETVTSGPIVSKPPVSLSAGEQMVAVRDEAPKIVTADLEVSQAWEVGHLVFRGETLADAVDQVNRYTDRPIIVDPSAASIRISGVFNTGDIGSFVNAITGYFPVEATTDGNNTITLQKRS